MFTDEDRKRALEALAANGGRAAKTPGELGYPPRQTLYRRIEDDRAAVRRTSGRPLSRYSQDTRERGHGPFAEGLDAS